MHSLGSHLVPTCVIVDGSGKYSSPIKGCLSDSQLSGYIQGYVGE
jgi:hypothetical protein